MITPLPEIIRQISSVLRMQACTDDFSYKLSAPGGIPADVIPIPVSVPVGENPVLQLLWGTLTKKWGGEMGYIVPADAPDPARDRNGFMDKAVDMLKVEGWAKNIDSKHALFMFDSCFSGSLFSLSKAAPAVINYKTSNPVRQFITAGSEDETVPDKSIFSQQFLDALNGEGDGNSDGYITGSELGEYLQSSVVNYSYDSQHPQYGKIRDRRLDKGDFVFMPLPVVSGSTSKGAWLGLGQSPLNIEVVMGRDDAVLLVQGKRPGPRFYLDSNSKHSVTIQVGDQKVYGLIEVEPLRMDMALTSLKIDITDEELSQIMDDHRVIKKQGVYQTPEDSTKKLGVYTLTIGERSGLPVPTRGHKVEPELPAMANASEEMVVEFAILSESTRMEATGYKMRLRDRQYELPTRLELEEGSYVFQLQAPRGISFSGLLELDNADDEYVRFAYIPVFLKLTTSELAAIGAGIREPRLYTTCVEGADSRLASVWIGSRTTTEEVSLGPPQGGRPRNIEVVMGRRDAVLTVEGKPRRPRFCLDSNSKHSVTIQVDDQKVYGLIEIEKLRIDASLTSFKIDLSDEELRQIIDDHRVIKKQGIYQAPEGATQKVGIYTLTLGNRPPQGMETN